MMSESDHDEDILFDLLGSGEDEKLLKNPNNVDKISGKAWGRVKNIFTRKSDFPISVFFILGTEFCERFCYYGLRTILVLYLTNWLMFGKNQATAIFHLSSMFAYFSPLLGAIIADGYLGRYRTILYVSVLYAIGNVILSLTALPPRESAGAIIGLLIIGLGTGGIKPCVSAFGGDQFAPEQEKERTTFFSAFYFMINLGSVFSTFLTPVLRADVHCIENTCYPLAFGVPAFLMFIALVIFYAGRNMYKRIPPTGNIIGKVFRCIMHGISHRCKSKKTGEKRDHWLDHADDKFEVEFIDDVKILLKVLWLFLPLPVFWALFDQQGSRWTLQAELMDGSLGKLGRLKPDQFQVLNPLMIILFIPIFEKIIYPALDWCKVPHRPLQRMVAGMLFGCLAFSVAALVQIKLDNEKESPLSSGQTGVTLINMANCPLSVDSPLYKGPLDPFQASNYTRSDAGNVSVSASCLGTSYTAQDVFHLKGGTPYRLAVMFDTRGNLTIKQFSDQRTKAKKGNTAISIMSNLPYTNTTETINLVGWNGEKADGAQVKINITRNNATEFIEVDPGSYKILIPTFSANANNTTNWKELDPAFTLGTGAVYSIALVNEDVGRQFKDDVNVTVYVSVKENDVSMFYLVPQYMIITIGEVLFSITGLSFAYSQAPKELKSVVQAAWLMTVAVGDLVVVIVAEVSLLPSQTAEFFMFSALMGLDTILFAIMTIFYKYNYVTSSANKSSIDDTQGLVGKSDKEEMPLQDKGKQE